MALAGWARRQAAELLVNPPPDAWGDPWTDLSAPGLVERLTGLHQCGAPGSLLSAGGQGLVLELLRRPWDPQQRLQIQAAADGLRRDLVGDGVSYVVNRNLNISNHCIKHCGFCAFRRDPGEPGAYWLPLEELQRRAAEAQALGATELCLQGGLNPQARLGGSAIAFAERLLEALLEAAPGMHLHAFSPQELLFLAEQDGLPLQEVLLRLRHAGLGSVPGTAAEVLSEPVRRRLCPEKLSAQEWLAVVLEVMAVGLPATSTLMAGHLEQPADLAAHLL